MLIVVQLAVLVISIEKQALDLRTPSIIPTIVPIWTIYFPNPSLALVHGDVVPVYNRLLIIVSTLIHSLL